jgi:hypothetical protein
MNATTVSGTAAADQGKVRIDITRGDGTVLKDNTFALSINGGRGLRIVDPAEKTYFDVDLDQLLGGVTSLVQQLGGLVKVSVENVKVNARDAGDGGTIEGYATRRALVDSSYDLLLDAFGQKTTIHVVTNVQSWVTSALPAEMTSVFQMSGVKTGIAEIDKIVQAQMGSITGFPLKQISAFHAVQNGTDLSSSTTTTITAIQKKNVAPERFDTPEGYEKTDSPFDALVKSLKTMGGK